MYVCMVVGLYACMFVSNSFVHLLTIYTHTHI